MNVRDGMTDVVLTVGPAHTLREAAHRMSERRVGAAVVTDSEHAGIGILTERDILDSLGAGQDPDTELVADHRTGDVVFASPNWTLEHAATQWALALEAVCSRSKATVAEVTLVSDEDARKLTELGERVDPSGTKHRGVSELFAR